MRDRTLIWAYLPPSGEPVQMPRSALFNHEGYVECDPPTRERKPSGRLKPKPKPTTKVNAKKPGQLRRASASPSRPTTDPAAEPTQKE